MIFALTVVFIKLMIPCERKETTKCESLLRIQDFANISH